MIGILLPKHLQDLKEFDFFRVFLYFKNGMKLYNHKYIRFNEEVGALMERLSPEEQLMAAGKTQDQLGKEIMDYLVMLYSDQMGVPYEYQEVPTEDKTA